MTRILLLSTALFLASTSLAHAQDSDLTEQTAQALAPPSEVAPLDDSAAREQALRVVQEAVEQARENIQSNINQAQNSPPLPPSIQALVNGGARALYLGTYNNFNGWVVLNNGAPSYVYVSPDGQTIFRGFLFDDQGTPITVQQVTEAQLRHPDFFGIQEAELEEQVARDVERGAGETLYDALSVSNYFTMGAAGDDAPVLYAFLDPDCPHCKSLILDLYPRYLANNQLQLRVIPIGVLSAESEQRAATLLAADNPAQLLKDHSFGVSDIEIDDTVSLTNQDLNVNLFTLWQFDGTPILVFKDKQDVVQLVRGTPRDLDGMINLIKDGS